MRELRGLKFDKCCWLHRSVQSRPRLYPSESCQEAERGRGGEKTFAWFECCFSFVMSSFFIQVLKSLARSTLTSHARWNGSQICWIYLTCASGREPIEHVWKREVLQKMFWKVFGHTVCPSIKVDKSHCFCYRFGRFVGVSWRASMCPGVQLNPR